MRKSKNLKMMLKTLRGSNKNNHKELSIKYYEARKKYLEDRQKKLAPA